MVMKAERKLKGIVGMRGTIEEIVDKIEEILRKPISYDIMPDEELRASFGEESDYRLVFDTYWANGDDTCHTVCYLPTRQPNVMYITEIIY